MKLLSKILLAADFRESSTAVTRTAATLATSFGSEVVPVHVVRDLSEMMDPEALGSVRQLAERKLHELARELADQNVTVATPIVTQGLPSQQILNHASTQDANLILMGTGQRDPSGTFRLGTTAEQVIRRLAKPVWVVPPGSRPSIRRMVCAVDFSDNSRHALADAVHLARRFRAELTVLTVVHPLERLLPAEAEIARNTEVAYARVISGRYESLKDGIDLHGVKIKDQIRHGRPADEIVRTVDGTEADLLVMGSSGKSALGRLFLGSVAENVLRRAPCAILTVRSEHAVRVDFEARVDDTKTRLAKARELLGTGFAAEAIVELEAVMRDLPLAAPVWQALATAHRRLGHEKRAVTCESRAKYLRESLWMQMVEDDIRDHHDQPTVAKDARAGSRDDRE